jgi:hypothetical protein
MRKELIETYIDSLRASFGSVRLPVAEEELQLLYNRKDYAGMVSYIRNVLRLDMGIRLGLVNSGGRDAPAWIVGPVNMPMLGTQAFKQLTVTMYLKKSFLTEGYFEATVCAIAHELCHVVLSATWHPLRQQEEAVDLTAMLLGFRDFYVTGCRSVRNISSKEETLAGLKVTETRTQSYLTYEEIGHAATHMTFR